MAYLDFTTTQRPDTPGAARRPHAAPPAIFSGLEWTVIALARQDGLASLATPGRLSRAIGGLFGLGAASRLADRRLEALRRFAIRAWHQRGGVSIADREAFLEAGFSAGQIAAVIESVARANIDRARSIAA